MGKVARPARRDEREYGHMQVRSNEAGWDEFIHQMKGYLFPSPREPMAL